MELELGLDPGDAARLLRLKALAPLKCGKARTRALNVIWYDSPDRSLARQGLALAEQRPYWRLERMQPATEPWPPGAPVPVLATARRPDELGDTLPQALLAVAAVDGRTTSLSLLTEHGPANLTLLSGALRTVAADHRTSRVRLDGGAEAVKRLALTLVDELRVEVPRACLAAEALAATTGLAPPARRDGAPELPEGQSVAEAFAYVVGHLSDVILYYAPAAATGCEGPEPVHQMRVAVRRLRSALNVFRGAMGSPELEAADQGLKTLAARLAPTRDWDVFVGETAATVAEAFPAEQRLRRLLAAAERRRTLCHDELRAYLGSADFRRLGVELACLAAQPAPEPPPADTEPAAAPVSLRDFAAQVLSKRRKRLTPADDDLTALEPEALHAIRLRAKRMRYAAEIFAPLYPAKATQRFIRRLSRLQDRLGALNDGVVSADLLAELGGSGHGFATGLVLGFIGARSHSARRRIDKAWQRFHRLEPFWE